MSDRRAALVEEGFDLAIRIGALPDSRLIARRIDSARFIVCAAPAYLARAGTSRGPEDLAKHACVVSRSASNGRPFPWRLKTSAGEDFEAVPESRFTIDNGEALIDAALAGAGLVYIHSYMVQASLDAGKLTTVFETQACDADPIFAIFPHAKSLSPKVRAVVDYLAAALAGPG